MANIDPGLLLTLGAVGSAIAVLILVKAADQIGWRHDRALKTAVARRGARRRGEGQV